MKECKDSGILPCYRDGYGVWHYSDDTHDKVYELNKQMCDIESGLSNDLLGVQMLIADKLAKDVVEGARTLDWAKNMLAGIPEQLSRAKYEILDEILKEKNRLMEEKKTKTMTKAEAFEWLKGKKVSVANREINDKVQSKLFACGVEWKHHGTDVCYYGDYLIISPRGFLCHCDGMGEGYWNRLFYEEISADDILSIEIVEEKKDDERKGEILKEIAKLGEKISDLIEEYGGNVIVEIDQYEVILRGCGNILYRK